MLQKWSWVSLVAIACAAFHFACGRKQEAERAKTVESVVEVRTARSVAVEIPVRVAATGTFTGEELSEVAAEVAGRVAQTPVEVGDYVRRGQAITILDDRDARLRVQQAAAAVEQAQAAVRQAQARLGLTAGERFNPENVPEVQAARAAWESAVAEAKLAEADARRYGALVDTGDVSRSAYEKMRTQAETAEAQARAARRQYETAQNTARQGFRGIETSQAALSGARAELALAEEALSNTVIRAPFSGEVTARPIAVGEYVTPNASVATVVKIRPLDLELRIPEPEAGRVRAGLRVTATVAAYDGREFDGRITAINAAIDPQSRTFTAIASFENETGSLRPGMFATANVLLRATEEAVFVPTQAVLSETETDSRQVFVIQDGRARVRVIQTGDRRDDGTVRVLAGLQGGETVATTNLDQLFDGAAVASRSS